MNHERAPREHISFLRLGGVRPATGIQNPGTPKFLEKPKKNPPQGPCPNSLKTFKHFTNQKPEMQIFGFFFSIFLSYLKGTLARNLGSAPGRIFVDFFEEFGGSGVLDPWSWWGVSQFYLDGGHDDVDGTSTSSRCMSEHQTEWPFPFMAAMSAPPSTSNLTQALAYAKDICPACFGKYNAMS